jgi:hypothetical protein
MSVHRTLLAELKWMALSVLYADLFSMPFYIFLVYLRLMSVVNFPPILFIGGLCFLHIFFFFLVFLIIAEVGISKNGVKWKLIKRPENMIAWKEIKLLTYKCDFGLPWVFTIICKTQNKIIFHGDKGLVADFLRYGKTVPSELIVTTWLLKTKKIASWLGEPPEEFYKIMGIEKESVKKDEDR